LVYREGAEMPPANESILLEGTFGSGQSTAIANTTGNAARAVWRFMQAWLAEEEFADYSRDGITLWSIS
jgi:hypothetical protein